MIIYLLKGHFFGASRLSLHGCNLCQQSGVDALSTRLADQNGNNSRNFRVVERILSDYNLEPAVRIERSGIDLYTYVLKWLRK